MLGDVKYGDSCLTAIIWPAALKLTEGMMGSHWNANMLFYVADSEVAPAGSSLISSGFETTCVRWQPTVRTAITIYIYKVCRLFHWLKSGLVEPSIGLFKTIKANKMSAFIRTSMYTRRGSNPGHPD